MIWPLMFSAYEEAYLYVFFTQLYAYLFLHYMLRHILLSSFSKKTIGYFVHTIIAGPHPHLKLSKATKLNTTAVWFIASIDLN